jgi:hypothetical protein
MVIHDKWPVEHDAKSLVFDETSHFLHNLQASRDLAVRTDTKRFFGPVFISKTIILPRQARDKDGQTHSKSLFDSAFFEFSLMFVPSLSW